VVTDDNGRFLVPDLPTATYSVFVRGYGLVDSPRMQLKPSTTAVTLKATSAKTPQEAAKVYPETTGCRCCSRPTSRCSRGRASRATGSAARC
jgi:hypothetical protein